ncbi:hypothetical protein L6452_14792 [Arctium lappa]|uniref:Uncharacterized protein n=1 Tax=Arctium lappa TaxID=4217 RepID=A0ACB9CMH4_ARCLA|nr:hypothetical protein L6452_14792 [Arctium lappa]
MEIPNSVFSVIDHARSGRPGGCYLDIPSDVLHQTVTESEANKLLDDAEISRKIDSIRSVGNDEIAKAISLIRKDERPLIVFGKGAAIARVEGELKELVEKTGIPFSPTPMGKGLLPDCHELAATAARSLAIGKCDVAVVVGAWLNWLLHFGEPPKWSKDVKFILVDIDEGEIELRKPYLGLVGDAKRILKVLNKEIKDDPFCLGGLILGGKGYLVGTPDELKSALTESFSARKPAVINVTIDPYAGAESGRMQHKN